MFNVKIKRFYDTEQIQIFSQGMRSKGEVEKEQKVDVFTGEILKHNCHYDRCYNPFTDEVEYLECEPDTKESSRISASRTIHKIYDIARSNYWEWFLTFTFSPEKVKDRTDYKELSSKLSNWLSRMRKECPDMVYLVVPELHKDGKSYHFHGLFANIDNLGLVDSGKVDKNGNTIYNVGSYKFGFTTAERIRDLGRSCSYLSKYITKDLCVVTKGKKRYWSSRNVKLPVVEELHLEISEVERIRMFMKGSTYVKSVQSPYTDVTYIERGLTL